MRKDGLSWTEYSHSQYSEYETILQVQKYFKKSGGLSVFIPVSRQQKGIDFVIVNTKNRKTLTVQVKGSRSYTRTEIPKRSKKELFKYNFWFNNFLHRYFKGQADVYILFGLYAVYDASRGVSRRPWRPGALLPRDLLGHGPVGRHAPAVPVDRDRAQVEHLRELGEPRPRSRGWLDSREA